MLASPAACVGCAPTVVHNPGMTRLTDYDREMLGLSRSSRQPPEPIVDATAVARVLQVHPRTVQRWILTGKLRAHRKGSVRSRWRVSLYDFEVAYWEAEAHGGERMLKAMIRAGLRACPSLAQQLCLR
jgi:excisionase family DNA binding protein